MGASSPARVVYLARAVYPAKAANPPLVWVQLSSGSSQNSVKEQKSKNSLAGKDSVSAAASPGCPLNPNRRDLAGAVESWV
jgi:hypothetical protein